MIYKEYTWIGAAIQDFHRLQDSFRYYHHQQEQLKRDHDIYEPYKDELLGWNIRPLKGDISKIK